VLTESPDNVPALFTTASILQKPVDNPLLCITASLPLSLGDLDKRLEYALDGQGLRLPQCAVLLLLGLEGDIARIAKFIVQRLECSVVQPASLLQRLGDGGTAKPELHGDVRRGDGVCCEPHSRQQA
jgi:hypothetical protein